MNGITDKTNHNSQPSTFNSQLKRTLNLLQSLAELNLLLVRSLDSEELNSVLPERQTIYLCVEHLQSGTLHYLKQFVDVLNVDGDVVDGTVRHC